MDDGVPHASCRQDSETRNQEQGDGRGGVRARPVPLRDIKSGADRLSSTHGTERMVPFGVWIFVIYGMLKKQKRLFLIVTR